MFLKKSSIRFIFEFILNVFMQVNKITIYLFI